MTKRDLLIIMAKYPTAGKVKTRLAADIGKAAAARVYHQLIEHHRRAFGETNFAVEWRYAPARAPFQKLMGKRVLCRPQPVGDLGERMARIFSESFSSGYERIVMIGTDAPEMEQGTVQRGFDLLTSHDSVLQPTDDGGYALIGLRRMLPIFTGIAWSTAAVRAQTRDCLRRLGASVAELPPTYDIDIAADLARWRGGRPCGRPPSQPSATIASR